jgi:hypothetical protein
MLSGLMICDLSRERGELRDAPVRPGHVEF